MKVGSSLPLILFLGVLGVGTIYSLWHYSTPKKLSIFPVEKPHIITYTDQEDPFGVGNSEIISFSVDSSIFLSTTIGDNLPYPYAGFRIQSSDTLPFYNISSFDQIDIVIGSTNASFFILDLTTYVEGETHFDNYMSFRHHTKEIFVPAKPQTLHIKMKDVVTQSWWYELQKTSAEELGKPDFTRCRTLAFEINAVKSREEPFYMQVSSITFVDTKKEWLLSAIILGSALIISIITLLQKNKKTRPMQSSIVGKAITIKNYEEEEVERLCTFLADSYHNPNLSINLVSKSTGISVDKIPQLLMRTHNMQYKQYLNTIRVNEARRLLHSSDRQVSEIATLVGYNYPSTFNRVFKEITGKSPSDFRKEPF